jgi:hypothetical protein
MTSLNSQATETRRTSISRRATIEGYMALPVVLLIFCLPIDAADLSEAFAVAMGVSLGGCGCLLAISGLRNGAGWAPVAAGFALLLLDLHAAAVLLRSAGHMVR